MTLKAVASGGGGGGGVSGTGTANKIPIWGAGSPSTTLADSLLSQSGAIVTNSGTFRVDDGNNTEPGYTFANSSGSGMYRGASGTVLRFSSSGAFAFGVSTSQNVLIGGSATSVPAKKLTVENNQPLRLGTATEYWDFVQNTTNVWGWLSNAGQYSILMNNTNGSVSINNGFGSIAPFYGCRAWVNFDSTVSGTWAGGASTVTRVAGSTTATVTTTNNHGLTTGNSVYALSGVAVGYYTVTVAGLKTFTITTVATTALSAVPITFAVNNIRASGGVSSVTDISTGIFSVNFSTAMPDVNYAAVGTKQNVSTNSAVSLYDCFTAVGAAPGRTTTQCGWQCIENAAAADSNNVNIAVFR